MRQASSGDLTEALARLDGCGADPELIALAKRCLSAQPADRPRHAAFVAQAVTAYQRAVTERLRQAEMGRAQAQIKATEERKRRKLTVGLAAAVLALVVLAAGGGLFLQQKHAERVAEQKQSVLSGLDKASDLQGQARWAEARVVLEQAKQRLDAEQAQELKQRVEQALADLELVSRLDTIHLEASTVVDGRLDDPGADRKYGDAFAEANLAAPGEAPEVVARRVRQSGIRAVLVAALDDWTSRAQQEKRRNWALEVARLADPDEGRNRFRDPRAWNNKAALENLVAQARAEELSPQLLCALGVLLKLQGGDAVPLLRRGQQRYPGDFWLSFTLGTELAKANEEGAEAFLRAALALRPRTSAVYTNLGYILKQKGKADEALACFRKAIQLDPRNALAHASIGLFLADQGDQDEAIVLYRKAIEFDPKLAVAHNNLGVALSAKGKEDEAIACFRAAIKNHPRIPQAHHNLGDALSRKGQVDDAIAAYRQAIQIDPRYAMAHNNLGNALHGKRKVDEAIECYKKAIELAPRLAMAHYNLGTALKDKGKLDQAIACWRKAIEFDPGLAQAHSNLGTALAGKNELDEAIVCFRKAIRIDPKFAEAYSNLGNALYSKGKVDEAVVCYRTAIELDPERAVAHCGLAQALIQQGQFAQAETSLRRTLDLLPEGHPLQAGVMLLRKQCRYLLRLEKKLPEVLAGKAKAASVAEQVLLARLCTMKRRFNSAAQLYAEAFKTDGRLAEDLSVAHRYNAACAAALAGCGKGLHAEDLDDKEKMRWRKQALEWLRADLAARQKQLKNWWPGQADKARTALRHWQKDGDLAGLRDALALKKMSEEERQACQRLWTDVQALLKKAGDVRK
jgi:tetratricopeptide (TPR) repeat protein